MRKVAFALLGPILGFCLAATASQAVARQPVVVELFTSQGCSSCVKSGDLMADMAGRPHVLALTFAVDYWDYLGWIDTFAKPEFADRQRDYVKHLSTREVYTPQAVVDGRLQAAAVKPASLDGLVKQAARQRLDPPDMDLTEDRVAVGSGSVPHGGAEVWLVRYDPSAQSVEVKRGENRGRTIVEHNVVRELVRLGGWSGRSKIYPLPKTDIDGLKTVILVQGAHGGRILAVKTS